MKIALEPELPESIRLDALLCGETFMVGPAFYMRVSDPGGVPGGYHMTVNLQTGECVTTRGSIQVVPVALSGTKATKLKVAPAPRDSLCFQGLNGGSS